MQGLEIIKLLIAAVVGFNVLILLSTVAVKVLRSIGERRRRSWEEELDLDLQSFLAVGDVPQRLRRLKGWGREILSERINAFVLLLSGAEREKLIGLAQELGLTKRDLLRLGSRRRWSRARAAENLGYVGGREAVFPLTRLLSDEDETVRAVAARALSRIGTPEAARALAGVLDSPSELTGLRAAENLERIGPLATPHLTALLGTDKRRAQLLAARILGNLRAHEARNALRQSISRHQPTDLKAQAALALGKIGDPEDVPALLEATGDEEWPVRTQAANALGMIGETSAIPTLEAMAADREWWVRVNASRALAGMGPEGERALLKLLATEDRFARDRAAAALENQGITRRMVNELNSPNARGERARTAVRAMVRAGHTRYLRHVEQELTDGEKRETLQEMLHR